MARGQGVCNPGPAMLGATPGPSGVLLVGQVARHAELNRRAHTLEVRLLGAFAANWDGEPLLRIKSARLQSLFAYLVLHRETACSRKHLAFLMWPDSSDEQAHTNLRKHLFELRHALPDPGQLLIGDAQNIRWNPGVEVRLDVDEFSSRARKTDSVDDLRLAVDLYQGDLLPSCYDDWIAEEREHLRGRYLHVLERLMVLGEVERDYSGAIHYARRLLQHEPLRESAYRQLVRLYALDGDRAEAMHTYHSCATILQRELGVEPSKATQEVYEGVYRTGGREAQLPLGRVSPLVGRAQEWRMLLEAWASVYVAAPRAVVLSGEAGIGKTRLAEELLTWASRQGIRTVGTRCYAMQRGVPYSAVAAWLRAQPLPDLEPIWLTEVVRLVPDLLVERPDILPPGPLQEEWQRLRLNEALVKALLEDGQELILFIDDLHWSDDETLKWLDYFLHRSDPAHPRLLILGTVRSEERADNTSLDAILTALQSTGELTEIELGPLDEGETTTLAENISGRQIALEAAGQLYKETEGNPLFTIETVHAYMQARAGGQSSEEILGNRPAGQLPERERAVLAARLALLSPHARDLAMTAAVIGHDFTFDVLQRTGMQDEEAVVHSLDELWHRRIVRERGDNRYEFSHDKLREVAYAGLSSAQRRLLHKRIAGVLAANHPAGCDAQSGQIAHHYEKAGMPEQAVMYYRWAATYARSVYANREAADLLRHALALVETPPLGVAHREIQADLSEELGDVLNLMGQHDEAREVYEKALATVPECERLRQSRLYRGIGCSRPMAVEFEKALEAFDIAESLCGEPPAHASAEWWHEWLGVQFAKLEALYIANDVIQMATLTEKLRQRVEQHGTPAQRSRFLSRLPPLAMRRDRYRVSDQTIVDARASLAASREVGDLRMIAAAQFGLGFCYLWHGETDRAEEELLPALELAEKTGNPIVQSSSLTYLSIICRERNQVDEVRRYAARSLEAATAGHVVEYIPVAWANQAWVAWKEGRLQEAEDRAREAVNSWEEKLKIYPFQWPARWLLISLALDGGRVGEAVEHARALLGPIQCRLPDELEAALLGAIETWETGDHAGTPASLIEAVELAKALRWF